jgi:hypothetical protein
MTRIPTATLSMTAATLLVALGTGAARADTVVQIPLPGVIDRRSVTTVMGQTLVVFNLATDGGGTMTGDGAQNAFATQAVAMSKGQPVANALPDDGKFPGNTRHPDVVLNFSNAADPTSPQTRLVTPTGAMSTFSFPVPAATYSKLFLFFHGAAGGTTVKATFTYSDGTTDVTPNATIPDYFNDPPAGDLVVFVLAPNLAKWSKATTIAEANHHNICGAELHPAAGKTLTMVKVERGTGGYLVFWGATGIATSAVAGLDGGSGDASAGGGDAGTAGTGGGAGASGTGGTSGAAGTAGGAGTGGGAGVSGGAGASGAAGAAGAAGATGAAGGGAAGSTTTGAAGATGAAGSSARNGGGCACRVDAANGAAPRTLWIALGAASAWFLGRRRRRTSLRRP